MVALSEPIGGSIPSAAGKASAAAERLRGLVASLPVGSRIPGERELASTWEISRMTARRAVEALVADGLIERRQGSGSYVTEVPYARVPGLSAFSAEIRRRGGVPSTEVLQFEADALASDEIGRRLSLRPGERVVWFTRLRSADDLPVAIETTWIGAELVPGLSTTDLSGSLYEVLENKFGLVPGQATSAIDAVGADTTVAERLDVGEGAPCLRVEMDYLDTRRRPLMAARCLYRPDRYHLNAVVMKSAHSGTEQAS